jgi:hypothetical protein
VRRKDGPAVAALLASLALPAGAAEHLLFTEFAVTPTDAEFVEIYNPTGAVVDLSDYYISDYVLGNDATQNYWHFPDRALVPAAGFDTDFLARFPAGSSIQPGQTILVALHDDGAFSDAWAAGGGARPDFEFAHDGTADGVGDMIDPGPATIGQPLIQGAAGLSNGTEAVVLFRWDGQSDLVQDVDIVQWQAPGGTSNTLFVNKSGAPVDGPDADATPSTYLPDTPPASQDVASRLATAHDFGFTVSRVRFDEGTERLTGGNGITGNDETSENMSATWRPNTAPSLGSLGDFGPPVIVAAAATAPDRVEIRFSRRLDPATAEAPANYAAVRLSEPGGEPLDALAIESAELLSDQVRVALRTAPQAPTALYEFSVSGVLTADLGDAVVPGTTVRVRGFYDEPAILLEVPGRSFVPSLDGTLEITYVAPQGEEALLRVFDLEGRELLVLAEEPAPPGGVRTVEWDGRDRLRQRLRAGVYVVHLELMRSGRETAAPVVIAVPDGETLR